jgi:hypothetical protein
MLQGCKAGTRYSARDLYAGNVCDSPGGPALEDRGSESSDDGKMAQEDLLYRNLAIIKRKQKTFLLAVSRY